MDFHITRLRPQFLLSFDRITKLVLTKSGGGGGSEPHHSTRGYDYVFVMETETAGKTVFCK